MKIIIISKRHRACYTDHRPIRSHDLHRGLCRREEDWAPNSLADKSHRISETWKPIRTETPERKSGSQYPEEKRDRKKRRIAQSLGHNLANILDRFVKSLAVSSQREPRHRNFETALLNNESFSHQLSSSHRTYTLQLISRRSDDAFHFKIIIYRTQRDVGAITSNQGLL